MKLLVQADDYGFTKGVTAGIIDAIENGFLRNTGMFTNMPEAVHAASLIPAHPNACLDVYKRQVRWCIPLVMQLDTQPMTLLLSFIDTGLMHVGKRLKAARAST